MGLVNDVSTSWAHSRCGFFLLFSEDPELFSILSLSQKKKYVNNHQSYLKEIVVDVSIYKQGLRKCGAQLVSV